FALRIRNLLVAAVTVCGAPAFAADAIVAYEPTPIAPAVQPAFNWSGGYAGLHGAYGWGSTEDVNNPAAPEKDIDGWMGGVQAGYNFQFSNNIVLGVEADLSIGSINEEWFGNATNPFDSYYTEDKVSGMGTLRARL